jgi:hypothetical protein
MIWILAIIAVISWIAAVRLMLSRDRYKDALTKATGRVMMLTAELDMERNKPLTQPKPKAQDTPKRYSGAQLRRLAEFTNITEVAKTNSEVLREQNG